MKIFRLSALTPRDQSGVSLVAAIFLLLLFAMLAAFMATFVSTANVTSAQDVNGSRAYHAAQAGVEWGMYQVLDPTNATVAAMVPPYGTGGAAFPNLPACPGPSTLTIEGFSVAVTCVASVDYFEAGDARAIRVFQISATATVGILGTPGFVEREVRATVSKCRARDGVAPGFECP